jgi:hypothetical protein
MIDKFHFKNNPQYQKTFKEMSRHANEFTVKNLCKTFESSNEIPHWYYNQAATGSLWV